MPKLCNMEVIKLSLSARRAWIEIRYSEQSAPPKDVALRKESVDRNFHRTVNIQRPTASLSARRAWIEMSMIQYAYRLSLSLSARRAWIEIEEQTEQESTVEGRSPQGERG